MTDQISPVVFAIMYDGVTFILPGRAAFWVLSPPQPQNLESPLLLNVGLPLKIPPKIIQCNQVGGGIIVQGTIIFLEMFLRSQPLWNISGFQVV